MKTKIDNFIEWFKENESMLSSLIENQQVQELMENLRAQLWELGFNEYGIGYADNKFLIELPGKSNFLQVIINDYFRERVEQEEINLVIYPFLRKKESKTIDINGTLINVEEAKYSIDEANLIESDLAIYHPQIKELNSDDQIGLLYAILDSQYNEFEQLFYFNKYGLIETEYEELKTSDEAREIICGSDEMTLAKWKETYYVYDQITRSEIEYRDNCIAQVVVDPRLDVEYLTEEKLNEGVDVLSIKYTIEEKERVGDLVDEKIGQNAFRISQLTNEYHIKDYVVFDRDTFMEAIEEIKALLNIDIEVYDAYNNHSLVVAK